MTDGRASTSGATSDPQDKKSVGTDPHPPTLLRSSAAEALGTALLVIGGVGTAVIAGDTVGDLGVAPAFGPSAAGRERGSRSVSCWAWLIRSPSRSTARR
ncbi:hypothetical protein GCM10009629_28550 [Pseudonocardia alni]